MATFMAATVDFMVSLLAPMLSELSFFIFFALGYVLLRMNELPQRLKPTRTKKAEIASSRLHKTVEAGVVAGNMISAVKAWRAAKSDVPTEVETLKLVVQAMLDVEPGALVKEITGHMADHREVLCNVKTAAAVLQVAADAGQVVLMDELHEVFYDNFCIRPYAQAYEVLFGGYASAGDEKRVAEISSKFHASKITPRAYALSIKGFLKKGMVDPALKQILDMQDSGFTVPAFALLLLIRIACEVQRGMEIFSAVQHRFPLPPDATALLLEDCLKHSDLAQARQVEQAARQQAGSTSLTVASYAALLKNCVLHNDMYAFDLFEEMQKSNVKISDRLCVGLIARCAESKFLRFAEEIVKFVRGRDGMSLAVYSALMKVYAFAGMYDKACDLHDQIIAQGLEPDATMYGCLMKFAVECGRTDWSRELFNKVSNFDVKHYMSMIRAAGRDKDVERAFQVLQKLKESSSTPDLAVYNCVLDVCVSAGELPRAQELITEMRTIGKLNIITYNTFLKGFCSLGDIQGAKKLLVEMENDGVAPNQISYNCLINAAVSKGRWQEAWKMVDMMKQSGLQADSYTLSIMMKALRKSKDPTHVHEVLSLLDLSGLVVSSDEVLMSTMLETCIHHRQHRRLEQIVASFEKSSLQPGVHTIGSLIKACGILQWVDKCWEFWYKMVDDRALVPNDIVFGCMLDALVCNGRVEEAVSLFRRWQANLQPNAIMYSVLIKGFTNNRQASRAMDMWLEMRESKVPLTTTVYNGVIDAHARLGLMDDVSWLVQSMDSDGCTADAITYSTIVKGYCCQGNLDKAFEVYGNMQENRLVSGSVVHNVLLDGCVRQNRMDLADVLLEDMEKFNIPPSNFTLGIMIKMWGRRKRLDKAFQVVEELPKRHGFKANAQTKTCFMCACLNNHDLDAAGKVFEELRTSEQGADWKAYASIIGGLSRHGQIEQAIVLMKDAYGLNAGSKVPAITPCQSVEMDCLEQLLRILVQEGQMVNVGLPLLNQLRAANVQISGKILSTFTSSRNVDKVQGSRQ